MAVIACLLVLMATARAQPSPAPAPPPLVREGATVRLTEDVWVIPDFNAGLVPNVGIVVGTRATLVVDTGLGPRNGEAIVREMRKVSTHTDVYVVTTHYHPEHSLGMGAFKGGRRSTPNCWAASPTPPRTSCSTASIASTSAACRRACCGAGPRPCTRAATRWSGSSRTASCSPATS
jgi:hypothetical protein